MAGSYRHCVDADNNLLEEPLLDDLWDALEAIEEMYDMINYLALGDKTMIYEAYGAHCLKRYGHLPIADPQGYWHD